MTSSTFSVAFANAQRTFQRLTQQSGRKPQLPIEIKDDSESFRTFGVIAERDVHGKMQCNLKVRGGLGGQRLPVVWHEEGHLRFLFALTIVLELTAIPDDASAPLAGAFTEKYRVSDAGFDMLEDGSRFQIKHVKLARMLEKRLLTDVAQDSCDVLTLPMPVLMQTITLYIREIYPD